MLTFFIYNKELFVKYYMKIFSMIFFDRKLEKNILSKSFIWKKSRSKICMHVYDLKFETKSTILKRSAIQRYIQQIT